jgi:hypothetical protein
LYPTAQHQYSGQEVETHGTVIREAIEIERLSSIPTASILRRASP